MARPALRRRPPGTGTDTDRISCHCLIHPADFIEDRDGPWLTCHPTLRVIFGTGHKALQTRRAPPAFARGASLATWPDGIAGHAPPETDGTSDEAFPQGLTVSGTARSPGRKPSAQVSVLPAPEADTVSAWADAAIRLSRNSKCVMLAKRK